MGVMETGSLIQPCPQQEGLRYAFKDEHEGAGINEKKQDREVLAGQRENRCFLSASATKHYVLCIAEFTLILRSFLS
jgi:hypothetical protein